MKFSPKACLIEADQSPKSFHPLSSALYHLKAGEIKKHIPRLQVKHRMNSKPSLFCSTLHPPTFALHFQVSLELLRKNKANLCRLFIVALTLGFLSFFIRYHSCFFGVQHQSYPPALLSACSPCQQSNSPWNVGKGEQSQTSEILAHGQHPKLSSLF